MTTADWRTLPLPDVLDFQEGPGIMAADFRDAGIPLIRLSGLEKGRQILNGCNYLDPKRVQERWAHFRLKRGDTLLSTSATLGRTAVVDEEAEGSIAYTGIIRFRPRDASILPEFIPFVLQAPAFQDQAESMGVGSVIRHFGPMHLRQMHIPIPPLLEQRRIAHILGTLDDKIELNRRMAGTLEEMARAIFKSWFIDFDPVRAKAESRPTHLPPDLSALFPDSFEDDVPTGWKLGELSDLANLSKDQVNPSSQPDSTFDHFSIPAYDNGRQPVTEFGTTILSQKFAVPRGSVLVSKLNPEIPRVWLADVRDRAVSICSTEFLVLTPKVALGSPYIYCLAHSQPFRSAMEARVTGTSKSHQRAQPTSVMSIPTPVPSDELVAAFSKRVGPLLARSLLSIREASTLAALRDALLPKLISGDLRVGGT